LDNFYDQFPHAWFWLDALMTQVYAWWLLGLACRIVPRSWQDSSARKLARRRLVKVKSVRGTAERKEVAGRQRLFVARDTVNHASDSRLAGAAGGGLLRVALDTVFALPRFDVTADILTLLLAGGVLKIWLASRPARRSRPTGATPRWNSC